MERLRNAPLLLHLSWKDGDPHGGRPGSSSQNGYEMFRLPHALGELQPCCSGGSVVWEAANVGSGSCSKKATVWRTSDGKSTAVMCALLVSVRERIEEIDHGWNGPGSPGYFMEAWITVVSISD